VPSHLPLPQDPIVAIATAPGRGAVGIVRVSGRGLEGLIRALTGRSLMPRAAHLAILRDAQGEPIDRGLALHFPAPASYTGEDVLELQAHGGPVVLQLLLARCLQAGAEIDPETSRPRLAHLRLAQPGEFTQRAFLNGKLDLAQAEAVADLIDADTEAAARSATRSLGGEFSREIDVLAERIVDLRALVEATLDFPEEEIDFLERADARGRLTAIVAALAGVLDRTRQGALLREGMTVVLAGQPNVGKSSLLNALAGAELAIVTPIAGTTRDKIGQTIQIEGVPVHVIDTAGLRDAAQSRDEVERLGMERSWAEIERADSVIFLHDLTRAGDAAYESGDALIAARLHLADGARVLHVFNKIDAVLERSRHASGLCLSARTGEGLAELRRVLLERAGWHANPEGVFIARTRHVQALQRCAVHLASAQALAARADAALDLLAEELRLAHNALGEITGVFTADDLLGEIFGRFCIGK
jgi:tRNA modification GTPase